MESVTNIGFEREVAEERMHDAVLGYGFSGKRRNQINC